MPKGHKRGHKRRCPDGKSKYFNEAWATLQATDMRTRYGDVFRTYRCCCGWWHVYNRTKQKAKRPTDVRRREERNQKAISLSVWEDEGGSCVWPSRCPEERDADASPF